MVECELINRLIDWYLCELSEGSSSAQPFLKRTSNKLQEQKGLELKLKGCNACFF